jgi:hypothetical protein
MAKQLAALLGGGLDLKALAEMLRRQGRGQDTILAHITPQEAALLKSRGGAGTMNPATGLPEFEDGGFLGGYEDMSSGTPEDMGYGMEFETPAIPMSTQRVGDQGTFYPTQIEAPVSYPTGTQDRFTTALQSIAPPQVTAPQVVPPTVYDVAPRGTTATPMDMNGPQQERSIQDVLKAGAKEVLGTREGLAGLGTAAALLQARQAGRQARRMQQELSQIGAPQRALGQEMIARGQRGEITPVQQQQLAALQAQQRQQLANRGLTSGTAAQQQQARMVEMQQRGAQDLIDQGIKIAGIGDQYQAAAIKAGYAADQATRDMLNTTLTNLYRTIYGNVATPATTSTTATPGKP